MTESSSPVWKLALTGLSAGLISGTMGIGGGLVIVPALVYLGFGRHRAHATSLAGIVLISSTGASSYLFSGEGVVQLGVTIGLGGVLGSVLGTSLMHRFSARTLTIVFGFVILTAAVRMISGASPLPGAANFDEAVLILLGVAIGLIAGTFAGIAGVGGGIVIVPSAVFFLGLAQHEAQGTSLLAVIFTSVSGTLVNLRNQRVRLADGLAVGVGGMAGSLVGSRFALGVDGRTLSFTFGLLVLFVAVRTLYRGFQTQPATA